MAQEQNDVTLEEIRRKIADDSTTFATIQDIPLSTIHNLLKKDNVYNNENLISGPSILEHT